ncbi:MAG: hypothetical protein CME63_10310 [Halobacteriovoraceae bacterium]|nr:hypothetical protein [Halobacteriovoraceae bacterium]|tara:strand:+ start:23247 stop:24182 length:936 start_codon:yes stop_codon:yes gene_type:complete
MFLKVLFLFTINLGFSAEDPRWITDHSSACKSNQLCAVGSGSSMTLAKSVARAELAKIFENKISSQFKSELASYNNDTQESVSEQVNEITEVALEGVEIAKVYEGEVDYFAMAVIDKNKMARRLKESIDKLDALVLQLFDKDSGGALTQIESLYLKRELLNQRYHLLTGIYVTDPVDYKKLLKKKDAVLSKYLLRVDIEDKSRTDNSSEIRSIIEERLISGGYKVSKKESQKITNEILGVFSAEKLYLKVSGFERYKFTLSLKAKTKKGNESGAIYFTTDVNARGFKQAKDIGLKRLSAYLSENIKKLNIE